MAEDLQNFVLRKLPLYLVEIFDHKTLDSILEVERSSPWLFIICSSDTNNCPTWQIRTKLFYFFVSGSYESEIQIFLSLIFLTTYFQFYRKDWSQLHLSIVRQSKFLAPS